MQRLKASISYYENEKAEKVIESKLFFDDNKTIIRSLTIMQILLGINSL